MPYWEWESESMMDTLIVTIQGYRYVPGVSLLDQLDLVYLKIILAVKLLYKSLCPSLKGFYLKTEQYSFLQKMLFSFIDYFKCFILQTFLNSVWPAFCKFIC